MSDLVIVSMHEKGFPQADFYEAHGETPAMEFEAIGCAPDSFFTMKRGETLEAAFAKATKEWSTAKVVYAAEDDDEDEGE